MSLKKANFSTRVHGNGQGIYIPIDIRERLRIKAKTNVLVTIELIEPGNQ